MEASIASARWSLPAADQAAPPRLDPASAACTGGGGCAVNARARQSQRPAAPSGSTHTGLTSPGPATWSTWICRTSPRSGAACSSAAQPEREKGQEPATDHPALPGVPHAGATRRARRRRPAPTTSCTPPPAASVRCASWRRRRSHPDHHTRDLCVLGQEGQPVRLGPQLGPTLPLESARGVGRELLCHRPHPRPSVSPVEQRLLRGVEAAI
jgi:hypothetical protein